MTPEQLRELDAKVAELIKAADALRTQAARQPAVGKVQLAEAVEAYDRARGALRAHATTMSITRARNLGIDDG